MKGIVGLGEGIESVDIEELTREIRFDLEKKRSLHVICFFFFFIYIFSDIFTYQEVFYYNLLFKSANYCNIPKNLIIIVIFFILKTKSEI